MEKPSLNIVRAADIAAHAQEFSHPWNPQSLMRGTQLGRSVGLKRTGVNFMRDTGTEDLVYLAGGENREFEVAEFPALGKRVVRMGQQVDVYDVDDAKAFGPL
jgi:uncharacterized cupin superfamily protein